LLVEVERLTESLSTVIGADLALTIQELAAGCRKNRREPRLDYLVNNAGIRHEGIISSRRDIEGQDQMHRLHVMAAMRSHSTRRLATWCGGGKVRVNEGPRGGVREERGR